MATLQAAFKAVGTGDSALMALLTGGVYDADVLDREGLTLTDMQKLPDGVRIKPCAVIRWGAANPTADPDILPVEARGATWWVYDDQGFVTVRAVIRRLKQLYHRRYITSDNEALVYVRWAGDTPELPAEEYGMAASGGCNFFVTVARQ